MADTEVTPTVSVTIDGSIVEARSGEMVIAAAERAGVYIPRFCYHPRLEPVGMCRMCLVNIDSGRGPVLQAACVVGVTDGMTVDTQAPNVAKAQDGILEFLLINHPLDCPVCDKGGECPLQDQTYAFGPGESRFVEEKRHFEKPIPISELVYLDRERCILCDRCTRFATDVAGDPLISFVERGNQTQVMTFPDHPFSSYFSGNTVQLCPVGALTAKPYRFKSRPWDLDQIESTCTTCSVGCRVAVQSSQNQVVRLVGIDSDPVNHGWLCDKGRFSYEMNSHPDRVTEPRLRGGNGGHRNVGWVEALDAAAAGIRRALDAGGPGSVAVIGGARLANEDAYAWSRLAKAVIGTDHVDAQLGDGLPAEMVLGLERATIDETCRAGTVLVMAPDLKEEAPVLYLRLRAAASEGRIKLVELSPVATSLSALATVRLHHRPGEAAAVARALRSGSGVDAGGVSAADIAQARRVLGLDEGVPGDVVCVIGRPSVAESAQPTVDAAAVLADAIDGLKFLPVLRRGNVMGALDAGLAPGVLPGRVSLDAGRAWFTEAWGHVPATKGLDTMGILQASSEGKIGALVLLGADPLADVPDRDLARRALATARFVVAVDVFETDSVREADVILPVTVAHEREGTTTNLEGRVTRLGQQVTAPGIVRVDWMVAVELARRLGGDLPFTDESELWAEIEAVSPSHRGITEAVLRDRAWRDGVMVPVPSTPVTIAGRAPGVDAISTVEGENLPTHTSAETETAEVSAVANSPTHASVAITQRHGVERVISGSPAPSPADAGLASPTPLVWVPVESSTEIPAPNSYSLRLVSGRSLYDAGVVVSRSESMAKLAPGPRLRVSPTDADRLGTASGQRLRVTSARATFEIEAMVDPAVPKGSAALAFNQPGSGAADLCDGTAVVNDLQVENV